MSKYKKNILIVSPSFYPALHYGGPIYACYYNAIELSKLGFDVKVVTTSTNGPERLEEYDDKQIDSNGLKIFYYHEEFKHLFSFNLIRNLYKHLSESDVIHIQSIFSYTTFFSIFLSIICNKQILISPHGSLSKWGLSNNKVIKIIFLTFFVKPFVSKLLFHVTSLQEKKDLLDVFLVDRSYIIPNAIDITEMLSEDNIFKSKEDWLIKYFPEITEDEIRNATLLISMGRLNKVKGFNILINAVDILRARNNGVYLLIAGQDFGQESELKKLILSLRLTNHVALVGHLDGTIKNSFFKSGDIFALPSYTENFGISYLEALFLGTPIVASIHTPWEEVEMAKCGKWVPNTPEDFAMAIEEILQHPDVYTADNARNYAKKFTWPQIAEQFKNVFEEMTQKKSHE